MIERDIERKLRQAARSFPSITITGPRQSGKTTLCKKFFKDHKYANLEDRATRDLATKDPKRFLLQLQMSGGAIIDELQRVPDLLSDLLVLIDENPKAGQWILTGSQNFALLKTISQSLAGRTAIFSLPPLTRSEIIRFPNFPKTLDASLFWGSFPRLYQEQYEEPTMWQSSYISTYLERDFRELMDLAVLSSFQDFMVHCAARTSQVINYAALANQCDISESTVKNWIRILETCYVIFRLPVMHHNISRSLTKNPKLHFYDTGLVCRLLNIENSQDLSLHQNRGEIFETWVVSEIMKARTNHTLPSNMKFYRNEQKEEADLVIPKQQNQIIIVEAKSTTKASKWMFDSVQRVEKNLTKQGFQCSTVVVYGGEKEKQYGTSKLIPWHKIYDQGWFL